MAVALASRRPADLMAVEAEIQEIGGRALAVPTDVSITAEVEHLIEETARALGDIDVLVNNAGVVKRGPVVATSDESWERVLNVNLKGAFLCTRAVLPGMIARRRGRILNVSSISGRLGTPQLAPYCASKWGLIGFTKAVAEETAPHDVQVIAVCPGSVATEMLTKGLPGAKPDMTPEAVASLLLYLATEAPDAMNGSVIDMFG
jgi:3-oxoacyl-[acyl-carrier protein] reductase